MSELNIDRYDSNDSESDSDDYNTSYIIKPSQIMQSTNDDDYTNDSDDDLVSIIHKVESFETYQMQERQVSTLQEQYPYFVAASLVCFLLEWIL